MSMFKTAEINQLFFMHYFCAKACIHPYIFCYNDKGDIHENNV